MSVGGLVGAVAGGVIGFFIGGPIGAFYGASLGFALGMAIDPITPDMPSAGAPDQGDQVMSGKVGTPIADLAGTAKIVGHLLCYGGERAEPVYGKSSGGGGKGGGGGSQPEPQITGYKYYMSWVLGIAAGSVDTLYAIYKGEDVVWEGELNCPASGGQETIVLNGMGSATFYFGTDDHALNSKVGALLDDPALNTPYRHLCWCFLDDCYIGEYNRAPTMKFVVKKIPANAFSDKHEIQTYDCNPSHAKWFILHALTGLPESWLHSTDFAAEALTLWGESRGLSILFDRQQSALNYLESINSHIDSILRYGTDGKFHPKLIRDDYTVGDLPTIDEDVMLDEPFFDRRSWIDTLNEMKVQYSELLGRGGEVVGEEPTAESWFDIDMSDSGKYQSAIASQPGIRVLFISKDYGCNWRYESSLQYSGWYCIRVSPSGQYQIAGNSSGSGQAKSWLSSDYGVTWTILSSLGAIYCVDAAFSTDGQYQTVVLSDKALWVSSDYGSSWTHTGSGFEDVNPKVTMSSSGQYQLVIYDGGYVYLSSDYGQTWADSGLGNAVRWHIAMSSSGQYQSAAVRYNSDLIRTSSNYGVTWTDRVNAPSGSGWSSIQMSADGQYQSCPTVGSKRRMYYSSDFGENWAYTFSTGANLDHLVVSESGKYQTVLRGFVSSGDQSKVFVSSDYGVNWDMKLDLSVYPSAMLKVAMSTSGQFQLAISNKTPGYAYFSSDYGETWLTYMTYYQEAEEGDFIDYKNSISDPIAVDIGNYVTQGRIVSKTIQLASFTTNENAVWAAKRQLQKESYPFAFISIPVNRKLFRLQVGDCFKFSFAKYGVSNMICRVLRIEEENLESEQLIIHAMEDIFSVSNVITEYSDPTDHATQPPSYAALPFTHQTILEAPYVVSEGVDAVPLACKRSDLDLGMDVYLSVDGGTSYSFIQKAANLRPYGTLVSSYLADIYTIDEEFGFEIDFVDGANLIETSTWSGILSGVENFAILGSEIISFLSITPVSGDRYKFESVIRGRYGTQKVEHAPGEAFYFLAGGFTIISHSEIVSGADLKFKLVPYNIKSGGEVAEATPIDLTIEGEAKKPYIPINFHANGSSFAARYSTFVNLTWSPRYRGRGAGIGVPGEVLADMDREGFFEIEVWVSDVKVRTATAIDESFWIYTEDMNLSDNGILPDIIEFKLLNYRTEDGVDYKSDQVEVVCKKGEGVIHIIPEGEPEGVWEQVGYSWAKERWGAVAAGVGNDFYAGLGQDENSVELSDWWKFDSVTGAWTQKTSFPGGVRAYSVAVECGGKIYVGTGYTGVAVDYAKDWWEYDPTTDTWSQKTDFGGGQRTKAMAAESGGKIYIGVGFGVSGGSPTLEKDWWEYDPVGDAWLQKADFSTDRSDGVVMGAGGKIYFGTGAVYPVVRQKDWWEYDPVGDAWLQKGDFSGAAKTGSVVEEVGGKLYFGLGVDEVTPGTGTYAKDWWEYTPGTDTWVQKADFGYWSLDSRDGACAVVAGGQVFVGLGRYVETWHREWREYDIGTDTWVIKTYFGDPNFIPRSDIVAAFAGGKVYAGTGNTGVGAGKQWWEYDPDAELWVQKTDFGDGRMRAVAAEAGGKVYVGTGIAGGYKKDWWEYDPGTDTWAPKLDFGGSARYGAVVVESGEKIYVGLGFSTQYEMDWWEYNPATNLWAQKADFGLATLGRMNGAAAEVDGRIFAGFGVGIDGVLNDWWEYSSDTNLWAQRANCPGVAGGCVVAVGLGSYIFVGLNGDTAWWRYDPVADSWVQAANFMGGGRVGGAGVALSSTEIFVVAGYGETYPGSDVWENKNDCWMYK